MRGSRARNNSKCWSLRKQRIEFTLRRMNMLVDAHLEMDKSKRQNHFTRSGKKYKSENKSEVVRILVAIRLCPFCSQVTKKSPSADPTTSISNECAGCNISCT